MTRGIGKVFFTEPLCILPHNDDVDYITRTNGGLLLQRRALSGCLVVSLVSRGESGPGINRRRRREERKVGDAWKLLPCRQRVTLTD